MLEFLVPGDRGDGGGCDICDRGLLVFLVEVAEMVLEFCTYFVNETVERRFSGQFYIIIKLELLATKNLIGANLNGLLDSYVIIHHL
ncbi:hypothetical protein NC651_007657 [Populus alba x Populus x berolinensis]|nr:hypothetical protein NC651_007657 [Populus alba x Populus x berolinensis]